MFTRQQFHVVYLFGRWAVFADVRLGAVTLWCHLLQGHYYFWEFFKKINLTDMLIRRVYYKMTSVVIRGTDTIGQLLRPTTHNLHRSWRSSCPEGPESFNESCPMCVQVQFWVGENVSQVQILLTRTRPGLRSWGAAAMLPRLNIWVRYRSVWPCSKWIKVNDCTSLMMYDITW